MSDTPRTDAISARYVGRKKILDHARQLERELNEAKRRIAGYQPYADNALTISAKVIEWTECERERDQLKEQLKRNILDSFPVTEERVKWERLIQERDQWKAAHDNQVKLRRALMDRPDLKERAILVTRLEQELNEAEERHQHWRKAYGHCSASREVLIAERDQLRKVADELAAELTLEQNPPYRCIELRNYDQLPHVQQRNTK